MKQNQMLLVSQRNAAEEENHHLFVGVHCIIHPVNHHARFDSEQHAGHDNRSAGYGSDSFCIGTGFCCLRY